MARSVPRRCETIVAIPGDKVDVVVKYLLPSGSPIGLSHVQTERLQSLSELGGNAMNGSHNGSRIVLCQRPYVRRMSSRYHQRVSGCYLSDVEKGHSDLVLVHAP